MPPGQDAVDYFLFESEEGFFDYHASAMVVLLRAVGIPSRLAVGYALDPTAFDAENRRYNIREEHAYAWAEVYLPGFGWLAFNPSPERPAVTRQGDTIIEGGSGWFGNINPAILGSLGLDLQPEAGTIQPEENPPAVPVEPTGGGGDIPLAVWLALGLWRSRCGPGRRRRAADLGARPGRPALSAAHVGADAPLGRMGSTGPAAGADADGVRPGPAIAPAGRGGPGLPGRVLRALPLRAEGSGRRGKATGCAPYGGGCGPSSCCGSCPGDDGSRHETRHVGMRVPCVRSEP